VERLAERALDIFLSREIPVGRCGKNNAGWSRYDEAFFFCWNIVFRGESIGLQIFFPPRTGTPKALGWVKSYLRLVLLQFLVPSEHPAFHKIQFCDVPLQDVNQEDFLCSLKFP